MSASATTMPWPPFVIDEIALFAVESAADALTLGRVDSRWRDAIMRSETIPEQLVRRLYHPLFSAQIRRGEDLRMTWETLRRVVCAARSLAPLQPAELLPIENCDRWRSDCPFFAEFLEDKNCVSGAALPLQLRCAACERAVVCCGSDAYREKRGGPPVWLPDDVEGPVIDGGAWAARNGRVLLRRTAPRKSYGIVVFDLDGLSAQKLCRQIRHLGTTRAIPHVEAVSPAFTPSFRYRGGSCTHQVELYPVTLVVTEGSFTLPEESAVRPLFRHQLIHYYAIAAEVPQDVPAEVVTFLEGYRLPSRTNARLPPLIYSSPSSPPILKPDETGAMVLVVHVEMYLGAESDSGSDRGVIWPPPKQLSV
jgi:hypothetical protein